jgi:hypothetical protein
MFKSIFSAVIFAFVVSGCATRVNPGYFMAKSVAVESTVGNSVEAETTKSARYNTLLPKVKSVALKAPSYCEDKTASKATGEAAGQSTVVQTTCGVEMAELERTLVKSGYNVYSWNMFNNRVKESGTDADAAIAAKKLGAQVLFVVNSLERVKVIPKSTARFENEFFSSDEYGNQIAPAQITEDRINLLKKLTNNNREVLFRRTRLQGAMLDVNAVDAETGQTIWFYRGRLNEPNSRDNSATTLFWCYSDQNCYVTEPYRPSENEKKNMSSGKEEATVEKDHVAADVSQRVYFDLLRQITGDFAKRFSTGQ